MVKGKASGHFFNHCHSTATFGAYPPPSRRVDHACLLGAHTSGSHNLIDARLKLTEPSPMSAETPTACILTRKVRKSGSEGLALLLALVGIFLMLFAWWPIGLLCIIGAFFADAKYGPAHYCPVCGNDVAPTSRLCPTCHNALSAAEASSGESRRAVLIALLVFVILTVFVLVSLPSANTARQTLEQSAEGRQRQSKAAKAEREQREQMAREIAARSESIDPKVKAALEQAKAEIDAIAPKSPPATFDLNNPAPPSLYAK
jgi:predicted nucleic acid-binding Zn ribbon protein